MIPLFSPASSVLTLMHHSISSSAPAFLIFHDDDYEVDDDVGDVGDDDNDHDE